MSQPTAVNVTQAEALIGQRVALTTASRSNAWEETTIQGVLVNAQEVDSGWTHIALEDTPKGPLTILFTDPRRSAWCLTLLDQQETPGQDTQTDTTQEVQAIANRLQFLAARIDQLSNMLPTSNRSVLGTHIARTHLETMLADAESLSNLIQP